ncbi:MAG: hypothetical protein ACQERK_03370 [Campylobacterota bacterium]
MKKNNDLTGFEALEKQLLAVYRSGVYISGKDITELAAALDFEFPMKKRESSLKKLIFQAKKEKRLPQLFDAVIKLFEAKIKEYRALAQSYENAEPVIGEWIQKAQRSVQMLEGQKQKAKEYTDE